MSDLRSQLKTATVSKRSDNKSMLATGIDDSNTKSSINNNFCPDLINNRESMNKSQVVRKSALGKLRSGQEEIHECLENHLQSIRTRSKQKSRLPTQSSRRNDILSMSLT